MVFPALSKSSAWFFRFLIVFVLVGLVLAVCRPAFAQSASAPVASASPSSLSYGALADLLENEQTRRQLVNILRELSGQASSNGSAVPAASDSAQPLSKQGASSATTAPAKEPDSPKENGSLLNPGSLLAAVPGASLASRLFTVESPTESIPAHQAPEAASDLAFADKDFPPETGANPADRLQGHLGVARRLADQAQAFALGLVAGLDTAADTVYALFQGNLHTVTLHRNWPLELLYLLIVLVVTTASFGALRRAIVPTYTRMDSWVVAHVSRSNSSQRLAHLYSRTAAVIGALVIDLGLILLAATGGYAVALLFTGESGLLHDFELMFVNTFIAVEVSRALIHTLFATRFKNLRLLPMHDDSARYWNNWLERVAIVSGYGVMLLVPIVQAILSPELARTLGLFIMIGVYVYSVRKIWINRQTVRQGITQYASRVTSSTLNSLLRMLARLWHVLAIAYFTVLLVISQTDPVGALAFVTFASLQTLLAVGLGVLVSSFLSAMLGRRIRLPRDLRARLPLLEERINAYVPAGLRWVRLIILGAVILVVLDGWQVFNISSWVASELGGQVITTIVHVSIVLLIAALAWTVVASVIEHRLSLDQSDTDQGPSARERTLLALFRNASLIVIVTMTVLIVLSQIGINIGPLIAGAGVVGLAIGFGAQKLVQDVINGIFIQLENGMNQNDVVEVAGVFGTVEKITIRSVGIRTLDGGYHMIPFSSVDKLTNHMRDFSYHLGEYTVAHRESVDDAAFHLERAFDELMTDPVLAPEVMEDMVIAGVTSLNERGFTIRIMIKTKPGMQWAVQRGYNRLVKKHFNAAGIELPYPHTVVYFGQDKNGDAPPLNLRTVSSEPVGKGRAIPAGHTPRTLKAADHSRAQDVLGNELATVVDAEGNVSSRPGQTVDRKGQDRPTGQEAQNFIDPKRN